MDVSKYAALFLAESREHLSSCNQFLLDWERDPSAAEPVAGLFRSVHTIKGMAATMGYAGVAALAHGTETLLDALRSGDIAPEPDTIQLLFRSIDAISAAVGRVAHGQGHLADDDGSLLEALSGAAGIRAADTMELPLPPVERGRMVRVQLNPETAMPGLRALLVVRRAGELGRVTDVRPGVHALERDEFSGLLAFRLETDATDSAVQAALSAVGDVATVEISRGDVGAVVTESRQVRVDLARLDRLTKQVGELVVARNRLATLAIGAEDGDLGRASERITRLVNELQVEVLAARMSPVSDIFDRFPRVVRDVARELGKQVRLETEGVGIELDRAVLDEIGEPLLHLIRNAIDHGLESPEAREAAGKPREGRIRLSATRERNTVLIRVADDGRGIDRTGILAKAKREGALDASVESLTDDLLLRLLARAGFTTAKEVSDLSGRGVGVDVVATRARTLGGTLAVQSVEGQGTVWSLRVPLTLAIVRALLIEVGTERYAIPVAFVTETVDFGGIRLSTVRDRQSVVLRDRAVPLVGLRELVGEGSEPPARRPCVILDIGDRQCALLVDRLIGQQDIVIEPFEAPRDLPAYFGGATILADGAPALVLDAAALV